MKFYSKPSQLKTRQSNQTFKILVEELGILWKGTLLGSSKNNIAVLLSKMALKY